MGGYDVFKSNFKDGKWSEPENIGYPINTVGDDVFFSITASERYGYFSSKRAGGFGSQDIYQITFLGAEKPPVYTAEDRLLASVQKSQSTIAMGKHVRTSVAVTLLKGTVVDAKTQTPLLATIEITDNELGKLIATFTSNSATGRYLVSLPSGKNYGIVVKVDGFLFYSENVDIRSDAEYQEMSTNIELHKIEEGVKVVLRNIFFDTGKATISAQSTTELERVVQMMNDNPKLRIEVSGHTDNVGTAQVNKKISEERAKAVVDYLVSKEIAAERLVPVGYGFDRPLESNETEEGRARNRRTEFEILGNGEQ
jgi:outer membrane protein OmpA-like peptidoglycan-associated protein